jgi:predicted Zn finger-like uncharacterized protein
MPTDVDCPSCAQKLRVPDDLLGKNVKCPACKTMFSATLCGMGESAPSRWDTEEPPVRSSSGSAPRQSLQPPESNGDEEDNDSRPSKRRRSRRRSSRDYQPHRGTIILVLGILAIVTGLHLVLGPIAWVMGNNDLKEIHAGRMDPEGEGTTNIGRILGMVATFIGIAAIVIACIIGVIWLIMLAGFFGLAAGASGR